MISCPTAFGTTAPACANSPAARQLCVVPARVAASSFSACRPPCSYYDRYAAQAHGAALRSRHRLKITPFSWRRHAACHAATLGSLKPAAGRIARPTSLSVLDLRDCRQCKIQTPVKLRTVSGGNPRESAGACPLLCRHLAEHRMRLPGIGSFRVPVSL